MVKVVLGETCPALMHYWDPKECEVIKTVDDKWVVLDHSIQTVVAIADTRKEADDFIIGKGGGQTDEYDQDQEDREWYHDPKEFTVGW